MNEILEKGGVYKDLMIGRTETQAQDNPSELRSDLNPEEMILLDRYLADLKAAADTLYDDTAVYGTRKANGLPDNERSCERQAGKQSRPNASARHERGGCSGNSLQRGKGKICNEQRNARSRFHRSCD